MANKIITIDAGHGLKTSGKQTASNLGTVYKEFRNSVQRVVIK